MPDPSRAAVAEWSALLDRFESDLTGAAPAAWRPASAPLPPELADRARRVLAAQRDAIARLERERNDVRGHLTALRRIPAAAAGDATAYVDLDG